MKFYVCKHCGNIIIKLEDSKVPVMCCGEKMEELIPGSVDAAVEKHVPVVSIENGSVTVEVGEVTHPMTTEHYIKWIVLETENGFLVQHLSPEMDPKVTFMTDQKVKKAYAYCNLHGLWEKAQ